MLEQIYLARTRKNLMFQVFKRRLEKSNVNVSLHDRFISCSKLIELQKYSRTTRNQVKASFAS